MTRKIFLAGALIAGFVAAGAFAPVSAQAMPISAPAMAVNVLGGGNLSEVAYVCRRVWTRWGWRRTCRWRPGGYGYYGYGYRPFGSYYGWRRPYTYYGWRRPYHRRYWY
jgi:hypothetical protein